MKLKWFPERNPLHLFLLPTLFVVNHFFTIAIPSNTALIDNAWAWIFNFLGAVIICCCLPFVLYKFLSLKFNKLKSALIATICFLPFFFFQDIFFSFESIRFGLRARSILPLIPVLLIGLLYWILKSKRSFHHFTQYLNVTSFALLIYTGIQVALAGKELLPRPLHYSAPTEDINCEACPDIYFILLDSYTSNQSLRQYFNFDNGEFTEALRHLNFSVADQATSCCNRTEYSLAAVMNPDQIPDLNKYTHGITQAIRFGTVIQSLKQTQYKIRNYSIFDVDDQPAYYSVFPSIPVGFLNGIVESSILNMIIYDLSMKMRLYGIHTEVLANITEAARSSDQRPMFVYAHLLAPHPPFVIDSTGREIHFFSQSQNNANTAAYVEQVKGLNKLVFSTVGDILDISPEAIIIVMGDHGYRYLSSEARDEEAFTVFLAYHGPNSESLESLTNSNQIFKLVFRGLE